MTESSDTSSGASATSATTSTGSSARWYHHLAWFWGGALLANFVPHFVAGISGNAFQSPFASPPGEGLSSAMINVGWGFTNLVIAYLLLAQVGRLAPRRLTHVAAPMLGVLVFGLCVGHHFAPFHGGE